MNKIGYIIKREYLIRIRKRTFWILTFLLPFLYAGIIGFSVYMHTSVKSKSQHVSVIDNSGQFLDVFKNSEEIHFEYVNPNIEKSIMELLKEEDNMHLLVIPEINIEEPTGIRMYSSKKSSSKTMSIARNFINHKIKYLRIKELGLDEKVIKELDANVEIDYKKVGEQGLEDDNTPLASGIAGLAGFLNYMFIFIYGSLVMRGVHEEKSNRIVEIIISSVRPFELMMGKIIGIALVGLTQFLLWVLLIAVLTMGGLSLADIGSSPASEGLTTVLSGFSTINMTKVVLTFVFFFVGGYLLYSSLFASIAAAVDNQSDMQQFMLPLTIPLIISLISVQAIIQAPHSNIAIWLSLIPLTSPISMMARISFGVPTIELVSSMLLLVIGFVGTTWIASKIYRIGILIYGSKISYKELWKWLFYK
ncbi:MAG: ABC transporter permease [Bacteroidota bacterium]|nr:ABC transporter permease [Bacteroidota bacterium]